MYICYRERPKSEKSTFTGECQQAPNASVKDRIFHYILVHSDPHRCVSTITDILWWRSNREDD